MSVDNLISRFGKSLEIYTRAESVDAGGAYTRVYTASNLLITVYLQPQTPNESMLNGAIRASTGLTAYVNAVDGTSLATGQRLVDADSTYEIQGFRRPDMRSVPDTMAYYILELTTVEGES